MALTSRITLTGPPAEDPEDFLASSLGVIFPDDVTNQHGDTEHGLLYTSPHLPKPLHISLADPQHDEERRLFSHYLWNSSLLLAELIEAGTLGLDRLGSDVREEESGRRSPPGSAHDVRDANLPVHPPLSTFSVTSLKTIEFGAGTALPSLLASLLGAAQVQVTDYPSPALLSNLARVVSLNAVASSSPLGRAAPTSVAGHEWGALDTPFAADNRHGFDRVLVCDCLWMPWQHENLRQSISWFLKQDGGEDARAWVVAGFHTGRDKARGFFDPDGLTAVGLEVETIWERDCDGVEREWVGDRGWEDPVGRKRWLLVAILRRVKKEE